MGRTLTRGGSAEHVRQRDVVQYALGPSALPRIIFFVVVGRNALCEAKHYGINEALDVVGLLKYGHVGKLRRDSFDALAGRENTANVQRSELVDNRKDQFVTNSHVEYRGGQLFARNDSPGLI